MSDLTLLDQAMAKAGLLKITSPSIVPAAPERKAEPLPLFELTREAIDAATIEERDAIIGDLQKWGMLHLPFPAIVIRFPQEKVANVLGFERFPQADNVWITMMVVEDASPPMEVRAVYTLSKMGTDNLGPYTKEQMEEQVARGETNRRMCVIPSGISPNMFYEDGRRGSKWVSLTDDADDPAPGKPGSSEADYQSLVCEALTILLASLAARNVVKDVRHNSRAGSNAPPRYVDEKSGVTYLSCTVVRPPPASEMESDPDHPPRGETKPHLRRGHEHTVVADTTGPAPEGTRVLVVGKGRAGRRVQWFGPTYVNVDKGYIAPRHYVVRP